MTDQEAYDIVVNHLAGMDRPSMSDDGDHCVYRTPDGLKCAVGALIPDDEYSPDFEGLDARWVQAKVPALQGLSDYLLTDLQEVHDEDNSWLADGRGLSRQAAAQLLDIGNSFRLNTSSVQPILARFT